MTGAAIHRSNSGRIRHRAAATAQKQPRVSTRRRGRYWVRSGQDAGPDPGDERYRNRTRLSALRVSSERFNLGGYGLDADARPGTHVDLHFTERRIWITPTGGVRPFYRGTYADARVLEFEGGVIRTGGGFFGGGAGFVGAAEGMAIASMLNTLTTKTTVHTTVRFEAEDAELFFFTSQAVPRELQMRFAEVRGRITGTQPRTPQPDPTGGVDIADRLVRLGEMVEKGLLTAEEFQAAKDHLLK